jgi:hypothetical protein
VSEEEEPELEVWAYPDWADEDEQRRAFILSLFANAEIDIDILLKACVKAESYVKTGDVPPGKPALSLAKQPKD